MKHCENVWREALSDLPGSGLSLRKYCEGATFELCPCAVLVPPAGLLIGRRLADAYDAKCFCCVCRI